MQDEPDPGQLLNSVQSMVPLSKVRPRYLSKLDQRQACHRVLGGRLRSRPARRSRRVWEDSAAHAFHSSLHAYALHAWRCLVASAGLVSSSMPGLEMQQHPQRACALPWAEAAVVSRNYRSTLQVET